MTKQIESAAFGMMKLLTMFEEFKVKKFEKCTDDQDFLLL